MASTSTSTTARSTATSSVCARNSRRSIRSSRRSKPSMASVTDTPTAKAKAARTPPPDASSPGPGEGGEWSSEEEAAGEANFDARAEGGRMRRFHWPRVSPLTRRIVAVNVLPLALLAVGFLYLGKFEASLIGQQIEMLHTQGDIFAAALSEAAVLHAADEGAVLPAH